MFGANVLVWFDGRDAQQTCTRLMQAIRQQGSQPVNWDGRITNNANSYAPVCSDSLNSLRYEVVDTGGRRYGTSWCQWLVQEFGGSGLATEPDLFGIIRTAQQLETELVGTALAEPGATLQALAAMFEKSCREYGGYVDNGYCYIDYPNAPHQPIPLNMDGTWNESQAEAIRLACENAMQVATSFAESGSFISRPPQYYPDTGVCIQGES